MNTIVQSLFDTTNEAVEINCPGTKVNIQYIPIEWHMHIHQETDAVMNQITPRSIPALRLLNNDYLADAFFYLSNDRGQSIINHVTDEFNQSYSNFMKLNPEFKGKIAIVAYSYVITSCIMLCYILFTVIPLQFRWHHHLGYLVQPSAF